MATVHLGQRVIRSGLRSESNQHIDEGHVGTVVGVWSKNPNVETGLSSRVVDVLWDFGKSSSYQIGSDGYYDLLLLDNAPSGMLHSHIDCDHCLQTIAGMRWKCTCPNYDLCTTCYMDDVHDVKHSFTRFTVDSQTGVQVPPRSSEIKTVLKGLYPGATVVRGKDWQERSPEGESEGKVLDITDFSGRPRSAVHVRWSEPRSCSKYRVGFDGKVDLKCVTEGIGLAVYSQHLPLLAEWSAGYSAGDYVSVITDNEAVQGKQRSSGLDWDPAMEQVIGRIGQVKRINTHGDVEVKYPERNNVVFTQEVLTKIPRFSNGDRVLVRNDLTFVKTLQRMCDGGWLDSMAHFIGGEGCVIEIDSNKNVRVEFGRILGAHVWHPCALSLIKKNTRTAAATEETGFGDDVVQLDQLSPDEEESLSDDSGEVSELIAAAKTGNETRVIEILSKSPKKANFKTKGVTALHVASAQGHMGIVEALADAEANLNLTDDSGKSPIHHAVMGDEPAILKYLIQRGADIDLGDEKMCRAIHLAAAFKHDDCARVLITQGCNVNLKNLYGRTPLHDAISQESTEVIERLLDSPTIDLTLINTRRLNPLQFAAYYKHRRAMKMIARAFPECINIPTHRGLTILHIAAIKGQVDIMKAILTFKNHGLCMDSKSADGQTALHVAATSGHSESVAFLVSKGADVNCRDQDGDTALHLIARLTATYPRRVSDATILRKIRERYEQYGCNDSGAALMCFLVNHNASLDVKNRRSRTPLSYVTDEAFRGTLRRIADKEEEFHGDQSNIIEGNGTLERNSLLESDTRFRNDDLSTTLQNNSSKPDIEQEDSSPEAGMPAASLHGPTVGVFDLVFKIEVTELDMGPIIGKGQFGVVHRAMWRGTPVAVKRISTVGSKRSEVEKEVSIHRRACHPGIVRMMALGYCEGHDSYVVMELINGSNLRDIIFHDDDVIVMTLSRVQKLNISRAVLQAIAYLHACGISHRDIKPSNILIETQTVRPYLCDLGLAHIKHRNLMSQSSFAMRGTPCYMPPEAFSPSDDDRRHSDKHDIWSVAGTLVELFVEKRLWGDTMNPMALIAQFMTAAANEKPDSLGAVERGVRTILDPCFNRNPARRPTALELLDGFNSLN